MPATCCPSRLGATSHLPELTTKPLGRYSTKLWLKAEAGDKEKVGDTRSQGGSGGCWGEPRAAQGAGGRTAQGQTPGVTVTGGDPTVPANTRRQEKACLNVKEKTGGTKLRKIPGKGLGMWYIAATFSIGLVPSLSLSFTGALFPQISLHHSQLNIKPQTKAYLSCFHMTHRSSLQQKWQGTLKAKKKKKDHQSETISLF